MIEVDDRAGSRELIQPLKRLGIGVKSTRLPFGDLKWVGKGEGGGLVNVGVEFKKLEEVVASLRSERLQGYQMRGMRGTSKTPGLYDFSYLLIEGELLYNSTNLLMQRRGRHTVLMPGKMTVDELLKRISTLRLRGGLMPWMAVNRNDTLQWILAEYREWTDKALDERTSHIAIYDPPPLMPISDFRRTVKTYPHIGMAVSLAVEQKFGSSLYQAAIASSDEWADICTTDSDGKKRRLGRKAGLQIYNYIHRVRTA